MTFNPDIPPTQNEGQEADIRWYRRYGVGLAYQLWFVDMADLYYRDVIGFAF